MSTFIQLHILTSYPASNLNRDDLGRPKTVVMGNAERLRVSSQSLKRAWRTSDVFQSAMAGHIGVRTKELGVSVHAALTKGLPFKDAMEGADGPGKLAAVKDAKARKIARAIAGVFGAIKPEAKAKKKDAELTVDQLQEELEIEQLAHVSPAELKGVAALVESCRASGKEPSKGELALLRKDATAVDIALFGRMLAAEKRFNVDAAAQVAHAMTVHSVAVEDDFFTAVDDLNRDDSGAGHMGVSEFGAGLFYLYLCIDRTLLIENLGGDAKLAAKALRALAEAACTVSPTGKQNSFASRANALYCLAEKGDVQPRTLSSAFLDPMDRPGDLLNKAVKALEDERASYAKVYGDGGGDGVPTAFFNVRAGQGSLAQVCDLVGS